MPRNFLFAVLLTLPLWWSCTEDVAPQQVSGCGSEAALATCLTPKFSPEYYIEQGVKYFQTMESSIPIDVIPNYSDLVIRWEWPPWLLLTGIGRDMMIITDILLKLNPTTYDLIDCRYFETQPFCRCHVIFNYSGELCPIYEEFTFNDQGEITFIEAWSDYESLLPMDAGADGVWSESEYWAMGDRVDRLANRVPGLGNATGLIDLEADWMNAAAANDDDLYEMVRRARSPIATWLIQLILQQRELNGGCHAPEGDVYPYYQP